jgi:signal transduction histidine kinase
MVALEGPARIAALATLAGVYVLAGKLGLSLAIVHPSASAVWAPTGIAIAALLWMGSAAWPAIFVGAFLVNVITAGSIATSLGIASGNTLEALIGAFLVTRFAGGRHAFDRARDTFRFAFLAGMVSTAVSATIGVASLTVGGYGHWADFGPTWMTWWMGDMGGALVVAPLLLLWSDGARRPRARAHLGETVLLAASLVIVGLLVFGWTFAPGARAHPLAFLCMPVLVWAAFRFDQRTAASATFAFSVIAVLGTLRGAAPLERWDLNASLMVLQVFMGVASVSTLALAAVVAEGRRVEDAIRTTSAELRGAMTDLEAFSHAISHDLRSPVGAVLNYANVIEEGYGSSLGEEGVRMLGRVRASAESAATMLDQLVQVGSVGHGREERQEIDMTSLAREVHGEILAAGGGAADIRFELPALPPAWGSAVLVRCVLRNLFSNAVRYTRDREDPRIVLTSTVGDSENTYSVIDNGIGFPPGRQGMLFEPSRRVNGTRPLEGAGLGLAIAARIIQQHRGRIWAESDGATGARVSFTLPRGASAPTTADAAAAPARPAMVAG